MNILKRAIGEDFKLVSREPMVALLFGVPLFVSVLMRFILPPGTDLLMRYTGFNLADYNLYILAAILLIAPTLVGPSAGFLMLDEKDDNVQALALVTPGGLSAYLWARLLLPAMAGFGYVFFGYTITGLYEITPEALLICAFLAAVQGILFSLILFAFADDKVKGLTLVKGLSLFEVLALADLMNNRWISAIASCTPLYWTVKVVGASGTWRVWFYGLLGFLVNGVWIAVTWRKARRKIY